MCCRTSLRPGFPIVFCGTAAGTVSAVRGAYYAHPQNKFWPVLHAGRPDAAACSGPRSIDELPQWGLGLTDIAKHVSGMDRELPPGALGRRRLRGAGGQDQRGAAKAARLYEPDRGTSLPWPRGRLWRQRRAHRRNARLAVALALADSRLELGRGVVAQACRSVARGWPVSRWSLLRAPRSAAARR